MRPSGVRNSGHFVVNYLLESQRRDDSSEYTVAVLHTSIGAAICSRHGVILFVICNTYLVYLLIAANLQKGSGLFACYSNCTTSNCRQWLSRYSNNMNRLVG